MDKHSNKDNSRQYRYILIGLIALTIAIGIALKYSWPTDYVFDPRSGRLFWCPQGKTNCNPPSGYR